MAQQELEKVIGYFWRYKNNVKNFGDIFGSVILRYLGFFYAPCDITAGDLPDRPVLTIGSILSNETRLNYSSDQEIDIWGCGIRHVVDNADIFRKCRFLAVRGELTKSILKLDKTVVVGDPGLILPVFYTPKESQAFSQQILLVPHFTRDEAYTANFHPKHFGCTKILSSRVILTQQEKDWLGYAGPEYNQSLDPCDSQPLLNGVGMGFFDLVDAVSSSRFVLTGSLHLAIVAHACGIPWAPLNDGYINLPAKWLDFGSSLGVRIAFFSNAAEGSVWWAQNVKHCRKVDTDRLVDAFLESR